MSDRLVVVKIVQLAGNDRGGRFRISAALGRTVVTTRRGRPRIAGLREEKNLGHVDSGGSNAEIVGFAEELAHEAMKRYHASSALLEMCGNVRVIGSAGRVSGRERRRSRRSR